MSDRSSRLESRLAEIDAVLAELAGRVRRLECAAGLDARAADQDPLSAVRPAPAAIAPIVPGLALTGAVSFAGRTLMVLGGAYVLRALADSGRIPVSGGVALGVVYASLWIAVGDRAAKPGREMSAVFHGLAGLLIGLPLVWEASTRFALLTPWMGAVGVGAIASLAIAAAWHRRLPALAGSALGGAVVAATALGVAAGGPRLAAWLLLYLSVAGWWLADARRWPWLCWPAVLACDGAVAIAILRRGLSPPAAGIDPVTALGWTLLGVSLAATAWRTLGRRHPAGALDVVQLTAATLLAWAATATSAGGSRAQVLAATAALAIGLVAYAFALRQIGSRAGVSDTPDRRSAFLLWMTVGFVFVAAAVVSLFPPLVTTAVFALLLLALPSQQAGYGVAAALTAGLARATATAFTSPPPLAPLSVESSVSMAIVAVAALAAIWRTAEDTRLVSRAARVMLGVLAVVVAADAAVIVMAAALPVAVDASALATLRTIVLAVLAIVATLSGRLRRLGAVASLATALLVAGGIKLVLEDFRVTRPAAMVVALAVYGAALIFVSRVGRRRVKDSPVGNL
jgi:hypothetical protein